MGNLEKFLTPIQERRNALSNEYIHEVLKDGTARAKVEASATMQGVRKAIGFDF